MKKLKANFINKSLKKYVFEPIEINDDEESHYDENSVLGKDKYSVVGDHADYYYDEGGDNTQGRYKQDTNKSEKFADNVVKKSQDKTIDKTKK